MPNDIDKMEEEFRKRYDFLWDVILEDYLMIVRVTLLVRLAGKRDGRDGRRRKFTKRIHVKFDITAVAVLFLPRQKSTICVLEQLASADRFAWGQ